MRKIDFWSDCLGAARRATARLARWPRSMLEVRANLVCFVLVD
ncbi:MAG TPA: hypothetical protein VLT57_16740 [Bryobacteraceae bacterium]|nr:hypothetical protein [Bryobacteraceae bacterium]